LTPIACIWSSAASISAGDAKYRSESAIPIVVFDSSTGHLRNVHRHRPQTRQQRRRADCGHRDGRHSGDHDSRERAAEAAHYSRGMSSWNADSRSSPTANT
jgi:hypothetical protein